MNHANKKHTGHFNRPLLLGFSALLFSGVIQAKEPPVYSPYAERNYPTFC